MKIAIHYFSGCGNTAWVATQAQKQFQAQGHEVVLMQNAQLAFPTEMPASDVDLFLSPVYFGGLPANMIGYYKRIPMVAGRKAIFWSVCGAKSGATGWMAKALLKERGYDIIATDTIVMPDTFLFLKSSQLTPEQRSEMLTKAKEKISQATQAVTTLPEQKKDGVMTLIFSCFVYVFYFLAIRHALGLLMTASSNCTHCKLCAENCPVNCIKMKDDKPSWNTGCINCFRCLNNCPAKAIDFSKNGLIFAAAFAAAGMLLLSPFVGIIIGITGLFGGFFLGAFIYQKFAAAANADKELVLRNKERVQITDKEKEL